MEQTILIIDDDPLVLSILKDCLRPHYQIRLATTGAKSLELAQLLPKPDLILLDVHLPDISGYDVCTALKNNEQTSPIPVIFLTSHSDAFNVTHGLELGAVDYVSKPISTAILLARIQTHLRLHNQSTHLEALVRERTAELEHSQELTIAALGSLAEKRDDETGYHIQRTSAYVETLARRLAVLPRYIDSVSTKEWALMWRSAPLHDLGKVGIPDCILLKPGKLTADEFEIMKRHPTIGRDALLTAEKRTNTINSTLKIAAQIAYSHHEHWDGTGYPEGLSGEDIPLPARLMAIADVYDALRSKRAYKAAMPHNVAVQIISEGRSTHFDPQIVDCFLESTDEFQAIASRFSEETN